jgi:RHS repeat-associated protein
MNRILTDTVPKTNTVSIITTFNYNPSGTLNWVKDGENHYTYFSYDASDRKTTMTYQDGSTQQWAYDDAGNLESRMTVNGDSEAFFYDVRNFKYANWWSTDWNNGIVDWCFFDHDATGRLTEAENGTNGWNTNIISDVHRSYDAAGHLKREQQIVTGLGTKTVNYPNYDDDDRLTRMYVSGVSDYDFTYSYDQMGRFEKITPTGASTAFQYYYDAVSNEIQRRTILNGGVSVDKLTPRDSLNRITRRDLQKSGQLFSAEAYTYDPMNRLTDVSFGSVSNHYGYYLDGEMNLAQYDVINGTPARTVNYTLDKAGNRLTVLDNAYGNASYTPNTLNQYAAVTGSSITNGNEHEISAFNGVTYGYINDERLSSASTGSTTYSMVYDALGRCMKRTLTNGPTTYYIYDGEKPILEYDSNGNLIARNVYGKGVDEILMRKETSVNGGAWFYYEDNHEGSITHLLNAHGDKIEAYKYDAFGAITTMSDGNGTHIDYTGYNNRFLFTGREYAATYRSTYNTPAFNFYEYRARAYNPTLGRFMSEDPKLFDAGDYNLFRYCHNDPIDFTDPMGLDAQAWIEAIVPGAYEYNQMVANFHAGNYGTAAGWAGTMLVSQYAGIVSGTSSTRAQASFRAARIAASERQVTAVLGKFENNPNFQRVAEHLGVKSFNIPRHIYDKMTPAQQWAANQKMLDRAIARGGDFLFDKPIKDINSVTGGLRQELNYLSEKGFKLSSDGWSMTKSEPSVLRVTEDASTVSKHIPLPEKP